ncbi:MAG TPA: RNA polymerase sigma factor [Vicinamibacteria bacterium]|nr:RNA polymerase sigma factor [Vicinamibacteria bacterium]
MEEGPCRPAGSEATAQPNLLVRHREGDPDAFRALVSRYRAPVFSYIIRCGVAEPDRDDLFQEIFLRIHRSAYQYDADKPIHPWLFTVVANAVRTYHRRRKVTALVFTDPPEQEPRDEKPDGEKIAAASQMFRFLERELEALPPIQREVLVLASIESVPQKDIAEALGIPLNTVKTHLRRARLKLIRKLSPEASS